jgi:hypothetical protein
LNRFFLLKSLEAGIASTLCERSSMPSNMSFAQAALGDYFLTTFLIGALPMSIFASGKMMVLGYAFTITCISKCG